MTFQQSRKRLAERYSRFKQKPAARAAYWISLALSQLVIVFVGRRSGELDSELNLTRSIDSLSLAQRACFEVAQNSHDFHVLFANTLIENYYMQQNILAFFYVCVISYFGYHRKIFATLICSLAGMFFLMTLSNSIYSDQNQLKNSLGRVWRAEESRCVYMD